MKRRSTLRKATDVSICPACGLRVSVGVQCATCNQWRHNALPCTDPAECSVHFTPFMCRSCLDIAVRVDITSRRQFPTVDGAQKWSDVVVTTSADQDLSGTASFGGATRGCGDIVGDGAAGDHPDEVMEASLRAPAIIGAVKAHVRQLKRHASSIAGVEEPERILSALDRVYRSDDESDSSSSSITSLSFSSDGDDKRFGRGVKSGGADGAVPCRTNGGKQTAAMHHTRHRYGAQPKPLQFAHPGKLAAVLRESLDNSDDGQQEDEVLIDLRAEEFFDNDDSSRGGVGNDEHSQLSSRTNSSSNMKRQAAAAPITMDKQRSMRYLRKGGDQDVLRDHFENISFKGDLESARTEMQQRKSAAAKKLLEQHKRVLRNRFLANREANGGGGSQSQRRVIGSSPTTLNAINRTTDSFQDPLGNPAGSGSLVKRTRIVVESHKRMYFADVPPAFSSRTAPETPATPLSAPSSHEQRRVNTQFAVRLSEMEELPEPVGVDATTVGDGGACQTQDVELSAEGSIAIRHGDMQLQFGWTLPF